MSFKALVLATFVSLVGCVQPKPVPKPPVVVPVAPSKAEDLATNIVLEPTWTLDLQEASLWQKRPLQSVGVVDVAGNWVSTQKYGGTPVTLTVMTMPVEVGLDSLGFIRAVITEQDRDENTRFFVIRKVEIESGEVAGFASMARMTSHGVMGRLELVTSRGNNGFIVSCGGDIDHNEEWQSLCVDVLASFALR